MHPLKRELNPAAELGVLKFDVHIFNEDFVVDPNRRLNIKLIKPEESECEFPLRNFITESTMNIVDPIYRSVWVKLFDNVVNTAATPRSAPHLACVFHELQVIKKHLEGTAVKTTRDTVTAETATQTPTTVYIDTEVQTDPIEILEDEDFVDVSVETEEIGMDLATFQEIKGTAAGHVSDSLQAASSMSSPRCVTFVSLPNSKIAKEQKMSLISVEIKNH